MRSSAPVMSTFEHADCAKLPPIILSQKLEEGVTAAPRWVYDHCMPFRPYSIGSRAEEGHTVDQNTRLASWRGALRNLDI